MSNNDRMTEILNRASRESTGTKVFLLGDFNAAAGKEDLAGLAARYGFVDLHARYARAHGQEPEPTIPADHPNHRIDYVFCNQPLEVEEARVIPTLASDHRPVLVRVRLDR